MKKLLRISVLLLLVVGIAAAIFYRDQLDPSSLENWVKDAGNAGPIVFMLIYIIGTVFFCSVKVNISRCYYIAKQTKM